MSREDTQKVRAWLVSKYVNIGCDEIDALLAELKARGMAAEPKVIDRILRRRFPESFSREEKSMSTTGRIFPPREKPQAAAPPPQTAQELEAIMKAYAATGHWAAVAPNSAPPWTFQGDMMLVGSRANLALLKNKLREILQGRPLRVSDVQEAVFALAQAGVFERVPEVKTAPVEAPEPSARELHNRQVRIDRAMNDRETSPIKGAKESAKPLVPRPTLTEEQKQAANEKAARDNAIVQEALSRINTYAGSSHSRTYSGRAALREAFQEAMDSGKTPEEVLAAVDARADQLAGNSSIR